jgi:Ni/Co efflux regulator RcnB
MINSKGQKIVARLFMLALLACVTFPATTFAQYQRDDQRRDRRDRRQDRRDDRRDDRQDRRESRRGNSDDGYPNLGGSFQLRQTALNAGYNNGIEEGRKDRQRGNRYDFRGKSVYQKATKDYSSKLGSRELYQRYLRMAYEHGYSDGYNGY